MLKKRLVPDAESKLYADLQWAGLKWDEGPEVGGPHGPYRQSERTEIYRKHSNILLDEGSAYRCFCTPQAAGNAAVMYVTSGCYQNCSSIPPDESSYRGESGKEAFTVRLKQPDGVKKRVYPDLVYAKIQRLKRSPAAPQTVSEDGTTGVDATDTILIKSDGTPTYHFANVVDDHLMKITHVIRGVEWMASTPLHYDIYSAFGWTPPEFAHVGLLVDQKQAKLSKRNADMALDVASMRNEYGVLPETLNNFLALLGWSNPTDNDVMEMRNLVRNFDLKFTRGNTMVRMEKLWYLQKQHVARLCSRARDTKSSEPLKPILKRVTDEVREKYPDLNTNGGTWEYCQRILLADSKSYRNARQWVERNRYFFTFDASQVPAPQKYYNKAETLTPEILHEAATAIFAIDSTPETPKLGDAHTSHQETLETLFHQKITAEIWTRVLDYHTLYPLDKTPESKPRLPLNLREGEGTQAASVHGHVENYARHVFTKNLHPEDQQGEGHEEEMQGLIRRYKIFNAALMKYLREKLSYGLPGPGISTVTALLGSQECRRRLQ